MKMRSHSFTLRQLQYACAVADHLSFRKAAETCHVAQPSLSAQVAELEATLGVQLFERDRRRVLVTARGAVLLERARQLLVQADDLAQAAYSIGEPFSGALRVGVIPTIASYLVPSATAGIRASYPRLTIVWIEDKTETLIAQLSSGQLDGAVLALEADIGDVEHAVIAIDPFVLVAPPDHALMRKRGPLALEELRSVNMLLLDDGHCFRQQALEACSSTNVSEMDFRATSLATLVQLVVQGVGITLLPMLALATETSRAELGVRDLAAPTPHRTIAMVWRKASPLGPTLASVAAAMREAYPSAAAAQHGVEALRPARSTRKKASRVTRAGAS